MEWKTLAFKIGDQVRLKGDTGIGTLVWISGGVNLGYGNSCTIEYPLGVRYDHAPFDQLIHASTDWEVWRQDDHGNKVRIQWKLTEPDAKNLKNMLEARGHKQMYWCERTTQ